VGRRSSGMSHVKRLNEKMGHDSAVRFVRMLACHQPFLVFSFPKGDI